MSNQTEVAMKIFSDVYGYPNWEVKAKEGQNALEIMKIWEEELRQYTPEQVKLACYRVVKYRKAQSFPTISHLMAELVDEEKKEDCSIQVGNVKEAKKMYSYIITHGNSSKLASQRTIWNLYQVEVDGYNHETDNLL